MSSAACLFGALRVKSSNDRPKPAMTPDEHFTWIYTVCPLCFDFSVENTLFFILQTLILSSDYFGTLWVNDSYEPPNLDQHYLPSLERNVLFIFLVFYYFNFADVNYFRLLL